MRPWVHILGTCYVRIQNPEASFQKLHFYVLYSMKEFFYTVADTVVEKSVIVLPFVVSRNTVKNCD